MSSGLHGRDHASNDKYMFRSVWQPLVRAVDDYFRHVRENPDESDKPDVTNQSAKPGQSHRCERHNERNCNCTGGTCADDDHGDANEQLRQQRERERTYRGPRIRTPEPNQYGNFRCPISGLACDKLTCREWCEGSGSGTTLNQHRGNANAAHNNRNLDSETGAS